MDLLKKDAMQCWNPKVEENKSMAKLKQFKTQVVDLCFIFNLEYR